ncbi:MAG: SDR family NAD(P)-dependent oxidoreductase [Gemmatimonadota bacterium]
MSSDSLPVSRSAAALVTGASSGIGEALARRFARGGYAVVLTARSEERLREVAGELEKNFRVPTRVIAGDLADPEAPLQIFEALREADFTVEALVNNAAFGTYGLFVDTDLEAELAMVQVNVASLTHLSKLFAREMVARGGGRILNVASTAAFQPGPLMAVYYATKAYVLSFSEALGEELRGTGVTVTALCPGPTATGFQKRADMEGSRLVAGTFLKVMDPAVVAEIGYEAMMRGERLVVPGLANRLLAGSVRFTPRPAVTRLVRALMERHGR